MAKPIKQFTTEVADKDGRFFPIAYKTFTGGVENSIITLFNTRDEAESDMDELIERGDLDDDEICVTEVILHADGQIFDGAGNELLSHIANQTRQSKDQVMTGFTLVYADTQNRLRREAEAASEGPGF